MASQGSKFDKSQEYHIRTHQTMNMKGVILLVAVLLALAVFFFTQAPETHGAQLYAPDQTYTLALSPDNALLQPLMCNQGGSCTLIAGADGWINVQLDKTGTLDANTVGCGQFNCASVKVTAGQSIIVLGSPVVYANLTATPKFNNWATNFLYLPTVER